MECPVTLTSLCQVSRTTRELAFQKHIHSSIILFYFTDKQPLDQESVSTISLQWFRAQRIKAADCNSYCFSVSPDVSRLTLSMFFKQSLSTFFPQMLYQKTPQDPSWKYPRPLVKTTTLPVAFSIKAGCCVVHLSAITSKLVQLSSDTRHLSGP